MTTHRCDHPQIPTIGKALGDSSQSAYGGRGDIEPGRAGLL